MQSARYPVFAGVLSIVLALLTACGDDEAAQRAGRAAPADPDAAKSVAAPAVAAPDNVTAGTAPVSEPARYVGDLDALKARGCLRILIPANLGGMFYLPREGWPVEAQQEAAASFARSQGLEPVLVPVASFADMVPALLDGRGDLIAANFTVTDARRRKVGFSVPLTTVRQQVLVAQGRDDITGVQDLVGRRLMVQRGSSFWERLEAMTAEYPGIELVARPDDLTDEEELDRVASGAVDASVRDSNVAAMYLAYRDDLQLAFELPGTDDIAWAIRPDARRLRGALNRYLHLEFLADGRQQNHTDGWDGIRKRKTLRVLLRNNAASYFVYRGELHGFEYELAKAFADAHQLRIEVLVPDSDEQLIDWLLQGRADVAAGFLEPDPQLAARGVAFSRPYHYAPRYLVVRQDDELHDREDLHGRTVVVRRSSPYWKDLLALQRDGVRLHVDLAADDVETEELIGQVAGGAIGATVADGHLLDIELARGLPVQAGLQLGEERAHAVAVRAGNVKLLAELDRFIKKQYRGLLYNVLRQKYFGDPQHAGDLDGGGYGGSGRDLSPYDAIIRRYAERYGFDWRLITAQMYQESRFDPDAESFAGARGLLQVMPRTARSMGFEDVRDPEQGIHAGIKYLDWVRNRFEAGLPFNERLWFSLAAYNAGHGHVHDARRLARQKGWNPDRWFDHVENAMLLLSKKQYANKARYGYVRGIEPVSYVRDIRQRYRAYADMTGDRLATSPPDTSPRGLQLPLQLALSQP